MNLSPDYPSLFQINTRVWLTEISQNIGRHATLDDIPDLELDRFAAMGFDWIWFLSVWCTGEIARKVSIENPEWRADYEKTLPDLLDKDIAGSGFAITGYNVHPDLGGNDALKRLRERLKMRGLKLMLDFVPNHMGPDHPWVEEHPEFFISGTENDLKKFPKNYIRLKHGNDYKIFAYGRDPYFSGWPDTVQLNYSNQATVDAMTEELLRISGQCDGVRCDMAMLILPDVFERTWGRKAKPFWQSAINNVHEKFPDFRLMAEVYWDMEWTMQQLGFDYAYDKRLYDRLIEGHARPVYEHLYAGIDYQEKLVRFLENHDESRAASAFGQKVHEAAAVITFFSPGLRFFHQGQFEGRRLRISPHLVRAPKEPVISDLKEFYNKLLSVNKNKIFREGWWKLLKREQAWEGNGTWESFIPFLWEDDKGKRSVVIINYAPHNSQCYIHLPFTDLAGKTVILEDMMETVRYKREGSELISKGLYVDLPAWGYHIFDVGHLR